MKKENKLVIKLLDALAAKHPHMSFIYGFNVWANQHVVEVSPRESFDSEQYLLDEVEATAEFYSKFQNQGLLFLSDDPYLKVDNPIYDSSKSTRKAKPTKRSTTSPSFQRNSGTRLPK
jgi:hypothetical protein